MKDEKERQKALYRKKDTRTEEQFFREFQPISQEEFDKLTIDDKIQAKKDHERLLSIQQKNDEKAKRAMVGRGKEITYEMNAIKQIEYGRGGDPKPDVEDILRKILPDGGTAAQYTWRENTNPKIYTLSFEEAETLREQKFKEEEEEKEIKEKIKEKKINKQIEKNKK